MTPANGKCAILYSGGTDSTCVAALMAQEFHEIHLLTFYEEGTKNSPLPNENIQILREKFPSVRFVQKTFSTDTLVRRISYYKYLPTLLRHGFFTLATPGFSSCSWHTTTVAYCQKHGLSTVADGLTKELMHFPGHMDKVVALFNDLYKKFHIDYRNPVREWDTPPDQQLLDRLIVDHHGFFVEPDGKPTLRKKTTGEYLYSLGVFPSPNIKGSDLDRARQHDCYPFVLFNIFAFWVFLPFRSYTAFETRMEQLFREKIELCIQWLENGTIPLEGEDP